MAIPLLPYGAISLAIPLVLKHSYFYLKTEVGQKIELVPRS